MEVRSMRARTGLLAMLLYGALACSGQVQASRNPKPGESSSNGAASSQPESGSMQSASTSMGATSGNRDADSGSGNGDPLVGSWTFRGSVPYIVTVTLSFSPDKTFTMAETVS